MRYLTILLALLIGCSSSTEPEPEKTYPKRYGEWVVENPNYGEWTGNNKVQSQAKSDTLVIDQPGDKELEVTTNKGLIDGVTFTISDRSVHKDDINHTKSVLGLPSNAFIGSGSQHQHWGIRGYFYDEDEWMELNFDLKINCDSDSDQKHFFLTLYTDDDKVFRVYRFSTDGYIDAIKDVAGCPMP